MGVITDLDEGNISTSIEEFSEEERQDYLVVREHFKAQFLKGFKKNQQGLVTRVQDFMMPSFTLKNKKVEVISDVSTSSSDLFRQLSSIMDKKIADIYKPMNDLKDQLDIMKKGKYVDDNCAFQTVSSSATPASVPEPLYGRQIILQGKHHHCNWYSRIWLDRSDRSNRPVRLVRWWLAQ